MIERPQPPDSWRIAAFFIFILCLMTFYALSESLTLLHNAPLNGGDWLGAAVCHRIAERSFLINGRQFPLCARCTGMYLGVALVVAVLFLAGRLRRTLLPPPPILVALFGLIVLMGVDGLNSFSHFVPQFPHVYEPRNWLRLLTGVGAGLAMGLFVMPMLAQTLWRNADATPVVASWGELVFVGVVGVTAVLLLLSNQPTISYVMALISTAGLLLIVTSLNAILWITLLRRDRRVREWREATLPLTISLMLAIGELSALAVVRYAIFGTISGVPGL